MLNKKINSNFNVKPKYFKYYIKNKIFIEFFYKRGTNISNVLENNKYPIHKGNRFNKVWVFNWHKGHRIGSFSFTRKPFVFIKKEKKKKR